MRASSDDSVRQVLEDHDYRIDVNAKLGHDDDKTEFIENAHATLDARHDVFTHYLDQDDWDLFFGVFASTDRVNHFLFGDYANDGEYKDDFDFYRTLDGYIVRSATRDDDDTTLIVASDHGFTELVWEVNCNQFPPTGWLSYDGDDHDSLADIDDEARAYSLIPGRFYLNLEGREPEGVVPESEYEAVREELRTDLSIAHRPRRPAGVQADRMDGETVFDGDHDEIAPDLVVIPADGFDLKSGFGGKKSVRLHRRTT